MELYHYVPQISRSQRCASFSLPFLFVHPISVILPRFKDSDWTKKLDIISHEYIRLQRINFERKKNIVQHIMLSWRPPHIAYVIKSIAYILCLTVCEEQSGQNLNLSLSCNLHFFFSSSSSASSLVLSCLCHMWVYNKILYIHYVWVREITH